MGILSGLFRSRDKPKNSTVGSRYKRLYRPSRVGAPPGALSPSAKLERIMASDMLQHCPERTRVTMNVEGVPSVMPMGYFEGS